MSDGIYIELHSLPTMIPKLPTHLSNVQFSSLFGQFGNTMEQDGDNMGRELIFGVHVADVSAYSLETNARNKKAK